MKVTKVSVGILICLCVVFETLANIQTPNVQAAHGLPYINEFSSYTTNDDWVEIYNPSQYPWPTDGWLLRDNTASQTMPLPDVLAPYSYTVIQFNGFLNRDTDTIKIVRDTGSVVDSVTYSNTHSAAIKASILGKTTSRKNNSGTIWEESFPTKQFSNKNFFVNLATTLPNSQRRISRPSEDQIRVRAYNDTQILFSRLKIDLETVGSFWIDRNECTNVNDTASPICSVNDSPSWSQLSPGVYEGGTATIYDTYGNIIDSSTITSFVVDDQKPLITHAQTPFVNTLQNEVELHAQAQDENQLASISVSIHPLRADGGCANQTQMIARLTERVNESNNAWFTLPLSQIPAGTYCALYHATDAARNNSNPQLTKYKFTVL